jgi:DNA-binding HxlR family transcriptional regulator
LRSTSADAECPVETNPSLPGHCVSEDDQRQVQARILWDLQDGPLRYGEIRSGLLRGADGSPPIAPRVLSRELKALAQSGLIARKDYGVVPPKVEYRLTPAGRSFIPVIAEIRKWGARHLGGERLRVAG